MQMVNVRSSNLSSVGYDDVSAILRIEFVNGRVYDYKNVPEEIHLGLMQAASKGKFFSSKIRDRYRCSRIK